jgi:Domain of unknown function (DUF4326)
MRHRLPVDASVPLGPPRVVHCERERYHRYIGRPGRLGNPFVIGIHGTREQVLAKHEIYVPDHPELLPLILALRGLTRRPVGLGGRASHLGGLALYDSVPRREQHRYPRPRRQVLGSRGSWSFREKEG